MFLSFSTAPSVIRKITGVHLWVPEIISRAYGETNTKVNFM